MSAVATTTFTGPDEIGRYAATTGRYRISVIARQEPEPLHPAIIVPGTVQEAVDPELARRLGQLRLLPIDVRFAERGTHPKVDELHDDIEARITSASLAVAREILPALAGLVDGDLEAAARTAFYSDNAMCETCTCSPGVSIPERLTIDGRLVDVWVDAIADDTK